MARCRVVLAVLLTSDLIAFVAVLASGLPGDDPTTVFPVRTQIDQSMGSVSGEHTPVDVMNWLIDEYGNLRVSPQVLGGVVDLLDETVSLAPRNGTGLSRANDKPCP